MGLETNWERKRFNYLSSEINALYHEAAVKMGLSDSAMDILYTICTVGDGCTQSDIYKLSGTSRQTINSAIRRLEQDGVLYLEPGGGRNTLVHLTEKGKQIAEQKAFPLIAMENEIFAGWTAEEQREYVRLTKKYRDDLKEKLSFLPGDARKGAAR